MSEMESICLNCGDEGCFACDGSLGEPLHDNCEQCGTDTTEDDDERA